MGVRIDRERRDCEVLMALRLVCSEEENEDKVEFSLPQPRSGVLGREGRDPRLRVGI